MTDEEFDRYMVAIARGVEPGAQMLKSYALSNDELAIYTRIPRRLSPGVIVLHRNGTWRYDTELPAKDMLLQSERRAQTEKPRGLLA
jgi:hypothetical protein